MIARSCLAVDPMGLPAAFTGRRVGALQALTEPPSNLASTCPSCHGECTSLEWAFPRHVGALQGDGPSPYNSVLGSETVVSGAESRLASGPSPTVVGSYVRGNHGFVWILNRCDFNFGRIGRRLAERHSDREIFPVCSIRSRT